MTRLAYFEGSIVPLAEATVSITCNTLHYGTGCFGGWLLRRRTASARYGMNAVALVSLPVCVAMTFAFADVPNSWCAV